MKYAQLSAFSKHLKEASPDYFSPVYFIITKNDFERKCAVEALLKALAADSKKRDLSVKKVDADALSVRSIKEELSTQSFFVAKSILIFNDVDKLKKGEKEALEHYFSHPSNSLYVVMTAATFSTATNFYKKAEKVGIILEIPEEKAWEKEKNSAAFVFQAAIEQGKKIAPAACQLLIKQVGTDRSFLQSEIEKLICFVGERHEISVQDVSAMSTNLNVETIWQLGEALFRCDTPSALRIGKAILGEGVHLLAFLKQLRYQFETQFQICCLLSQGGGPQEVSQKYPYMRGAILEKNMLLARQYGMQRFMRGLLCIDAVEEAVKNSQSDPDLLAEMLVVRLTNVNEA